MKIDVVGLIALMRSGRIPLIPPEEIFLTKVDKVKDSSYLKLTKKDKKALDSFIKRARLGIGREDDAETEVEDPDDYRVIIVPEYPSRLPIEEPAERELVPLPRRAGVRSRLSGGFKMGKALPDDAEIEVEDPDDYRTVIVPEFPIRVPQPKEADRIGVGGWLI